MKLTTSAKLVASALLIASSVASANIHINFGAITVSPDESGNFLNAVENAAGLPTNSTDLGLNSNTQVGITIDYEYTDNIVFELVAATPFSHEISVLSSVDLVHGLKAGETKHLPPTLLAQYHFGSKDSVLRPFVGAGLNYTIFFDEEVDSLDTALTGLNVIGADDKLELSLDPSIGLALQAGFNYKLNEQWGVHAMAMWADIAAEGEVTLNGAKLQEINLDVDPLVFMIGARYSF